MPGLDAACGQPANAPARDGVSQALAPQSQVPAPPRQPALPQALRPAPGGGVDAGAVHVVVSDATLRAQIIRMLVCYGHAVVDHSSAVRFFERCGQSQFRGCALLPLHDEAMDGLTLARRLASHGVAMPLIYLTERQDVTAAVDVMRSGAADVLPLPLDPLRLLLRVNEALASDGLRRRQGLELESLRQRLPLLTQRERQVLERVVAGVRNKQIAAELVMSVRTVEIHRSRGLAKLQVKPALRLAALWPQL